MMNVKLFHVIGPGRPERSQKGIVLLAVLWVLVLLAVIVGQFCYSMRTELNITRNLRDEVAGYYLARAGISLASLKIINGSVADIYAPSEQEGEEGPIWRINREIAPIPFGEGQIQVKIDNESGKININEADALLLQMLFKSFGIPEEQKDTIVESVLDWRDMDNFHRHYGAENDYYQGLPQPYSANNGPFRSIEELLLVKGVTPELWRMGLSRMVTVRSDIVVDTSGLLGVTPEDKEKRKINLNAAPVEVLRCFPGMTAEILQAIAEYRQKQDFQTIRPFKMLVGETIYQKISPYITVRNSSYYTIRATGLPKGARAGASLEALVRLDPRLGTVRVINWVDYLEPGREGAGTGGLPAAAQN